MNEVSNNNPSIQAYVFHAISIISAAGFVFSAFLPFFQHSIPAAAYGTLIPSTVISAIVFRMLTLAVLYKNLNLKRNATIPTFKGFGITYDNLCDFHDANRPIAAFFNIKNDDDEVSQVPSQLIEEPQDPIIATPSSPRNEPINEPIPPPPLLVIPQAPQNPQEVAVPLAPISLANEPLAPPAQLEIPSAAPKPKKEHLKDIIKDNLYFVTYTNGERRLLQENQLPQDRTGILYIEQEWKKASFFHPDINLKMQLPRGWKLQAVSEKSFNFTLSFPSNYKNTLIAIKLLRKLLGKNLRELEQDTKWEIYLQPKEIVRGNQIKTRSKWGQNAASKLLLALDLMKQPLSSDKTWMRYTFESQQKLKAEDFPKEWILDGINGRYELYFPLELENPTTAQKILLEKGIKDYLQMIYKHKTPEYNIELEEPQSFLSRLVK